MAFSEQDDAAYAADVDDPASSPLPTVSAFRRQRSIRNREFGLYASRLRQVQPPTKRNDAASDVEPLRFVQDGHAANGGKEGHNGQQPIPNHDDSGGNNISKAFLQHSDPNPSSHNKYAFDTSIDETYEEEGDFVNERRETDDAHSNRDDKEEGKEEEDNGDIEGRSHSFELHSLPTSPISPRWASLANSSTVLYNHSVSSSATLPAPVSSVHSSVASGLASTAPTSPISPTSGSIPATTEFLVRSSSSSPTSATPFIGLSSHPFAFGSAASEHFSGSTQDPSTPVEKREEPFPTISSSISISPPPAPLAFELRKTASPPGTSGTMLVGNFSRPRQPSVKQGTRDVFPIISVRPRQPEPIQLESSVLAGQPPAHIAWPRERARGLSISSNQSSFVHPPLTHRSSNDHLRSNRLGASSAHPSGMISPGLPRPPVAYNRTDSTGSSTTGSSNTVNGTTVVMNHSLPQAREPLPWVADEETRSSYRSQRTTSTAQKTVFTDASTARSSVLTKTSSRTSISWFTNPGNGADEGLSVEDVMGMYEKGFGDSTGAEDDDFDGQYTGRDGRDSGDDDATDGEGHSGNWTPSDKHSSAQVPGLLSPQILEAMSDSLPIPPRVGRRPEVQDNAADEAAQAVRTSSDIIRNPRLSSSVPSNAGFGHAAQSMKDRQLFASNEDEKDDLAGKRDSAKMLESDDRTSTRLSPVTPPLRGPSIDSRPGSEKFSSLFAKAAQDKHDEPGMRDRYGFRKQNQYITREQYDAWNGPYSEYIGRRRRKWVAYLKDSGLMTEDPKRFPPPSVKTKRFIRKGIPPEWRGAAWFYYAGGPSIVAKHPGVYDQLVHRAVRGEAKDVDVEAIERDLHRTFPDNVKFQFSGEHQPGHGESSRLKEDTDAGKQDIDVTANRPDEPEIVSKLRRVLLAFSIYNPRIGYCQSLNFLAGLLLLFVETEEQCFWLLNVITRIYLPGTHEMSLEGSKVDLSVLMAALQESLPGVWAKIGGELEEPTVRGQNQRVNRDVPKHGTLGRKMKLPRMGGNRAGDIATSATSADRLPPITLCMTAWFMSCFIGTLPIETTLRVWDIFFYEGSKTLFRVALAVFKLGEAEIRAVSDPMEMFGVVQGLPRRILDCNMLMEATFRRRNGFGHLSQENIEEKRREQRDALKETRNVSTNNDTAVDSGSKANSSNGSNAANGADDTNPGQTNLDSGGFHTETDMTASAGVRRKGTLFGRRRERRPAAEVM